MTARLTSFALFSAGPSFKTTTSIMKRNVWRIISWVLTEGGAELLDDGGSRGLSGAPPATATRVGRLLFLQVQTEIAPLFAMFEVATAMMLVSPDVHVFQISTSVTLQRKSTRSRTAIVCA